MQAAGRVPSPGLYLQPSQTSDLAPWAVSSRQLAVEEWMLSWWKRREANFTWIELHHPKGASCRQDAFSMD